MKHLEVIIAELQTRQDCRFRPATRLPQLPQELSLPVDLLSFYERFSEARLFDPEGNDPACHLLPPEEFVQISHAILGETTTSGIERTWYALAHVRDGNYLAIDLSPERHGLCYDCFHETYGMAGYCKVIALSFTELLNRVASASGRAFWLDEQFPGYGDAYDTRR